MATRVRNDQFSPDAGTGRSAVWMRERCWYVIKCLVFLPAWPWPSSIKCQILRAFGATVGRGVRIKPRVNIHFPWKLAIGDHAWIGEQVEIYNFESVTLGAHCCISQRVLLCAGNHDYRDPAMAYRNAPIRIEDGAWVGAGAIVGPGVTVGCEAVVMLGSIVMKNLPPGMVCGGNPCLPLKPRWKDGA